MHVSIAIRKRMCGFSILLASVACAAPGAAKTASLPTARWEESQPGCTFSRDDDGKYRYGFWTADFGMIVAIDSQELEKVHRRTRPTLALELTVRYRGKGSLGLDLGQITLEFVKHYNDTHHTLDPDDLVSEENRDMEALAEETERQVRKHPERKSEKEAAMAARKKDASEMIEFLTSRSLRSAKLDSFHPEAAGWIFFTTRSKWIEELSKQEDFVLRIPLGGRVFEFPFLLPPGEGDLILRRR